MFAYGCGFFVGVMYCLYHNDKNQSALLGPYEKDLPINEVCKMVAVVDGDGE